MKKFFIFAAVVSALAGCSKEMPTEGPERPVNKVTDLSVSGSFDWRMVSNVTCDFSAEQAVLVSVSMKEGAQPFATFVAGAEAEPFVISVPRTQRTLCISYETESGVVKSTVLPVAERLQFDIPADSRAYTPQTRANSNAGIIYYPDNGIWGTLMFEDLWPAYGDYDFNDVVLNYTVREMLDSRNMVGKVYVTLRVNAVGGSLPYEFYIGMPGVQSDKIASVEVSTVENAGDVVTAASLTDGKYAGGPAIIEVKGWHRNINKPSGSIYTNTERRYEMVEGELVWVTLEVTFKEPVAARYLTGEDFDFFLGRTDGAGRRIEIHMGGFKPSAAAWEDYYAIQAGNPNIGQADQPYFSNNHLVWGLNIPNEVMHGYEKVDFLEAYPRFREWAESNGLLSQDWYLHGEDSKLVHNAK